MALRSLTLLGKKLVLPAGVPLRTTRVAATVFLLPTRPFSVTPQNHLKQYVVEETDKQMTISAEYVKSPHAQKLIKTGKEEDHVCPLCALNIYVRHTDVLILSQFLREDGCMLPRRVTGLCSTQQSRVKYLVAMSQKAGLMPNLAPSWSKKDPRKRFGSKKYNRYFDESTLD